MKTQIDLKSAVIGLALGVLVTLGVAAAASSGNVAGRYQIAGTAAHGMVLDTATGQVWSGYFPTDQGRTDAEFSHPKNVETK